MSTNLSEKDKTLSTAQQAAIAKAKQDYANAYAKGDKAGMEAAHNAAESVRAQSGYSGGTDGSGNYSVGSTGSTVKPSTSSSSANSSSGTRVSTAGNTTGSKTNASQTVSSAGKVATDGSTYKVGADGKAPTGLKAGDKVVTAAGTYTITKVNSDGSYVSSLTDGNTKTSNYTGSYASPGTTAQNNASSALDYSGIATVNKMQELSKQWLATKDPAERQKLADQANQLGASLGATRGSDGVWYTADGQKLYDVYGGFTASQVTLATDNSTGTIITDKNGKLTLLDADGKESSYRGMISISDNANPNYKGSYIVTDDDNTGLAKLVAVTNNHVAFLKMNDDGSYSDAIVTDVQGNELSTRDLVFGEDNLTYNKYTGDSIGKFKSQYGIDDSNYAIRVGQGDGASYFTPDGQRIDDMSLSTTKQWTEDEIINNIFNALVNAGYNNAPQLSDYDTLTWEQALAQANEQLNGQYRKNLDSTLSQLDQRALESGFFGQLPTEALRQQAAANNELDRASAVNELARNLMGDSRNYAQTQFNSDTSTSKNRLDTISQIYNLLMDHRGTELQNRLNEATTQAEIDSIYQSTVNDAVNLYIRALSSGVATPDIIGVIKKQLNA